MTNATPRISVIVRSMNRLPALAELLERLLAQEHESFEIVVVEQTVDADADDLERLRPLCGDERVRLLKHAPLGGPGARNAGVRAARGDILLFIDDDDLPLTHDWIAAHEAVYADPKLVGLTGRHIRAPGEASPYLPALRPFIRKKCLSYSILKTPYTFARFDEDVDGVDWLHGTNASLRREAALRAGLWDTAVRTQDEHSFAFKLHRVLRPGEYLAFRTHPPVLRRLDIEGGMRKRRVDVEGELYNHLAYAHHVVGRYFPRRFRRWRPLYVAWAAGRTLAWVWKGRTPRLSISKRLKDIRTAFVSLPRVINRLQRNGPLKKIPATDTGDEDFIS